MSAAATSMEAWQSIAANLPYLRACVLLCIIASQDGATDEEIGERCHLAGNTVRPRRVELLDAGIIRDSGRTRPTASGRRAVVWEAVA